MCWSYLLLAKWDLIKVIFDIRAVGYFLNIFLERDNANWTLLCQNLKQHFPITVIYLRNELLYVGVPRTWGHFLEFNSLHYFLIQSRHVAFFFHASVWFWWECPLVVKNQLWSFARESPKLLVAYNVHTHANTGDHSLRCSCESEILQDMHRCRRILRKAFLGGGWCHLCIMNSQIPSNHSLPTTL